MLRLAHIINPVHVNPASDLYIAQPITFETMRRAQAQTPTDVEVELFTTQYSEDHDILPQGFTVLPDLERSVLDFGTFENSRKLPLLRDILDKLYEASDADYFIYTNTDISPMPFFYEAVASLIRQGYDGMVINRRTIPNTYTKVSEIPQMYMERGQKHNGFDCFVFKRAAYPNFRLANACLGAIRFDVIMLWNVMLHSRNYLYLPCKHLTFHIGNDRVWRKSQNKAYFEHNKAEALRVHQILEQEFGPLSKYPALQPYLYRISRIRSLMRYLKTPTRLIINFIRKRICKDC